MKKLFVFCLFFLLVSCTPAQEKPSQQDSFSQNSYAFQMNFFVDETASCPTEVKCDI